MSIDLYCISLNEYEIMCYEKSLNIKLKSITQ